MSIEQIGVGSGNKMGKDIATTCHFADIDGRFQTSKNFGAIGQADLMIEAVFENLWVEQDVFKTLDDDTSRRTILAKNTPDLDANRTAEAVADPLGFSACISFRLLTS